MAVIYQRNFVPRIFRKIKLWGDQPQYPPLSEGVQLTLDASQFLDDAEAPDPSKLIERQIVLQNLSSFAQGSRAGLNVITLGSDVVVDKNQMDILEDVAATKHYAAHVLHNSAYDYITNGGDGTNPGGGLGNAFQNQQEGMYLLDWKATMYMGVNGAYMWTIQAGTYPTHQQKINPDLDSVYVLDAINETRYNANTAYYEVSMNGRAILNFEGTSNIFLGIFNGSHINRQVDFFVLSFNILRISDATFSPPF